MVLITLLLMLPRQAGAATRSSANYSISAETMDGGGQVASSANYSAVASIEPLTVANSSSANYELRHGFLHPLWSGLAPVSAPDFTLQTWQDRSNSVVVTKYASDPDGDLFTVSVGNAAHGTTAVNNGVITYMPDSRYAGGDSFRYFVTDPLGFTVAGTVNVTVTPPAGNGLSILSVIPNAPSAGDVTLVFAGVPGMLYDIEETETLSPADWTTVGSTNASTNGVTTYVRTGAPLSAFYRIRYAGP